MSKALPPIEAVPLDLLKLDPENARQHPQDNLAAIKASLSKFGQPEPIVAVRKTGVVISGNGRLMAMRELGWATAEVQYVDWNDAKARAYSLVANRTAELAKWDLDLLSDHVKSLEGGAFDLTAFNFDSLDLSVPNFDADEQEPPRLDEKAKHTCPECGHVF